jgi:phage baseplate assembly protein V
MTTLSKKTTSNPEKAKMFDYAALERRLTALENAHHASLRFGKVTGVEGGTARVQMADGQDVVSGPLPTLQRRVLKDQEIKMPDVQEPVAVLFSGQGHEAGIVLGAYYNPVEKDPEQPAHMEYSRFSDGTVILYDREAHKYYMDIKGDVQAAIKGNLEAAVGGDASAAVMGNAGVVVAGDATASVGGNVKASVGGNANVNVKKALTCAVQGSLNAAVLGKVNIAATLPVEISSAVNITLKAPTITLAGLLTCTDMNGLPGLGNFFGSLVVRQGSVFVPDQDVFAGGVSARGHIHSGVESGPSVTNVPVGGAPVQPPSPTGG